MTLPKDITNDLDHWKRQTEDVRNANTRLHLENTELREKLRIAERALGSFVCLDDLKPGTESRMITWPPLSSIRENL